MPFFCFCDCVVRHSAWLYSLCVSKAYAARVRARASEHCRVSTVHRVFLSAHVSRRELCRDPKVLLCHLRSVARRHVERTVANASTLLNL